MDEIDAANEQVEQFTRQALNAALARRSAVSSTGICRSCTLPIEPERLRVNPTAALCHDCLAEEEIERQRTIKLGRR
ncbi:MAG: TraR/DksA C4-type zinc finger protein [Magnetospirillum sp.]|nr:TraR/DksA C4-type zinc finger protein [Magnetospirillum sp.]